MTTSSAADRGSERVWQPCSAAGWLGFAAAPTFALMAWVSANNAPPMGLCSSGSSILPIGGMYLLMSLFHLSPWLKLASGQPRAHT
jgi:hypothetical protein